MGLTKALLVFCEGPHDVAFCSKIFTIFFKAEKTKGKAGDGLKFSEYPSPFNLIFRTGIEKHAMKDLALDMAHKFFLPDRSLELGEWIILIFNTGGKTQTEKVKLFIKDFMPLYKQSSVFPEDSTSTILDARFLFLYDADHLLPNEIAAWMKQEFTSVEDTDWSLNDWHINENCRGAVQDEKGVYVWCGPDGKGTLEDVLLPVYLESNPELVKKSSIFVEDAFQWDFDGLITKTHFKRKAEKNKAVICSAGQGKRPGRPLSAIIEDNVLGENKAFVANPIVSDFAEFIREFLKI